MSGMDPRAEFDSKLVDLIHANPMLYEKELRFRLSSPYESMKRKTELWKSIAGSLKVETKYCIKRWKNLRDKFRREMVKEHDPTAKSSDWELYDKLRFLETHIKYHGSNKNKTQKQQQQVIAAWNVADMDAEQLIEEILDDDDDDPLQEAMDDDQQCSPQLNITVIAAASAAKTSPPPISSSTMKRIGVLLEGLDMSNRTKAEKRIVAYLCKCQLKVLSNNDVDDLDI